MMNHKYIVLVASTFVAGLFCIAAQVAMAQTAPFTVSVDKPNRELPPGGFSTFEIAVTNTSNQGIDVGVERTVNDLPDTSWHTSVCTERRCYTEDVSVIPAETIEPGVTHVYKMHTFAGLELSTTAHVTLRFTAAGSPEPVDQQFMITAVEPPIPIFRIDAFEPSRTSDPGAETEFMIGLMNVSSKPLELSMTRVENNFPDATWKSTVCSFDSCFAEDVRTVPGIDVTPGHAQYFKLRIRAGVTGGEGKVTLRFDAGEGVDPIYQQFIVTAATLGVEADEPASSDIRSAHPNPASSFVVIPLPTSAARSDTPRLELFDAAGNRVADLSDDARRAIESGAREIRIDLDRYASGAYFYWLHHGADTTRGTLVIQR